MKQKRLRIFAGPNGSGKTTIINQIKEKVGAELPADFFGVYVVNADEIESEITRTGSLLLKNFQIATDTNEVQSYFKQSNFSPVKLNDAELWKKFKIENSALFFPASEMNSYVAADIAEFIRQKLLHAGLSFTFETVMSNSSKLDFIKQAKENGYRTYLYFIATDDPGINIRRVNFRVSEKGHAVSPEIITKRYYKSLENLRQAVLLTNRAYIFDNSGKASRPVAEITDGHDVKVFDPEKAPAWFVKYLAG